MHSTSLSRQAGGTFLGFLLGLVVGLAIAAGVAVFVTKAPLPFVTRGGARAVDAPLAPGATAPDPNKPLYGRDTGPAGVSAPTAAPGSAAATPPDGDRKFSFYDVAPNNTAPTSPVPPVATVDPAKLAAKASAPDTAPADDGSTRYLLQAGAFKTEADADAMKARLALLGLTAQVSPADRDGGRVYRVRLGPGRADDVNRMKQTLAQNGIDAALMRAQP